MLPLTIPDKHRTEGEAWRQRKKGEKRVPQLKRGPGFSTQIFPAWCYKWLKQILVNAIRDLNRHKFADSTITLTLTLFVIPDWALASIDARFPSNSFRRSSAWHKFFATNIYQNFRSLAHRNIFDLGNWWEQDFRQQTSIKDDFNQNSFTLLKWHQAQPNTKWCTTSKYDVMIWMNIDWRMIREKRQKPLKI